MRFLDNPTGALRAVSIASVPECQRDNPGATCAVDCGGLSVTVTPTLDVDGNCALETKCDYDCMTMVTRAPEKLMEPAG